MDKMTASPIKTDMSNGECLNTYLYTIMNAIIRLDIDQKNDEIIIDSPFFSANVAMIKNNKNNKENPI